MYVLVYVLPRDFRAEKSTHRWNALVQESSLPFPTVSGNGSSNHAGRKLSPQWCSHRGRAATRAQGNQSPGQPEPRATRAQGNQSPGQPEPRATRVPGNQHRSWMLRLSCLEGLWRAPPDQQATRTSLTSGWRSYVSMHSGSGARPYQCITIRIPSTGSLDHYAVLNSFLFTVIG